MDIRTKHRAPSAACGYFATINCLAMSQMPGKGVIETASQLQELVKLFDWLSDTSNVAAGVGAFMRDLELDRSRYIESNPKEFPSSASKTAYVSNWVANYEISDRLQQFCATRTAIGSATQSAKAGPISSRGGSSVTASQVPPSTTRLPVHFLRHIERDEVSEEEARREPEMARFRRLRCFVESPGVDYSGARVGTVGELVGPPARKKSGGGSDSSDRKPPGTDDGVGSAAPARAEMAAAPSSSSPSHPWPCAELLKGISSTSLLDTPVGKASPAHVREGAASGASAECAGYASAGPVLEDAPSELSELDSKPVRPRPSVPVKEPLISLPARCLASPAAWLERHGAYTLGRARKEHPPCFVVDVLGHFVSAVPLWIDPKVFEKKEGGNTMAIAADPEAEASEPLATADADDPGGMDDTGSSVGLIPVLLEVNSSAGHYQRHPSLELLFRMLFGGQCEAPESASTTDDTTVDRDPGGHASSSGGGAAAAVDDDGGKKHHPIFLWNTPDRRKAGRDREPSLSVTALGPRKASSGGVDALEPGQVPASMLREWGIACFDSAADADSDAGASGDQTAQVG